MDNSDIFTLVVLVLLVVCSAYFSATETAFSSLNRIRVKTAAAEGNKRAGLVLTMANDYDKTLSTVLVGNNIVNIATASIATMFFVKLIGGSGTAVSTIVVTVVVLIFGEITPKSLAKESPEKFAMFSAPILRVLGVILTPVNFLFSQWKKLLSRIFKTSAKQTITEEELRTMVDEAEEDGSINAADAKMIDSAFEFNDSKVANILTPRVDVHAISVPVDMDALADLFVQSGYTRIPVYRDSLDDIIGMVHLHDFLRVSRGKNMELEDMLTPVLYVPPSTQISALLKLLQTQKRHMAVVTDEYGGTVGIVTMEDILEELVGEIWDEHDEIEENIRPLADGTGYLVSGKVDIEDVANLLGFAVQTGYTTVSGWITQQLGRLPKDGEGFTKEGIHVTVVRAEAHRVREAAFEKQADPDENPDDGNP